MQLCHVAGLNNTHVCLAGQNRRLCAIFDKEYIDWYCRLLVVARHFQLVVVEFKFVINKRHIIDERNRIASFDLSLPALSFCHVIHLNICCTFGFFCFFATFSAVVTKVFYIVYFSPIG